MKAIITSLAIFLFFSCTSKKEEQKELEYERVGPITDDKDLQIGPENDGDIEREEYRPGDTPAVQK